MVAGTFAFAFVFAFTDDSTFEEIGFFIKSGWDDATFVSIYLSDVYYYIGVESCLCAYSFIILELLADVI